MSVYDLTKIDLFSLPNLKRGELAHLHSILLFLYSKFHGNDLIRFKYSEVKWLNYNKTLDVVLRLNELSLIEIVKRPKKNEPFVVRIKPNHEMNFILNRDKHVDYEKYDYRKFSEDDLKDFLDCHSLNEIFLVPTIPSWIRNIRNKTWDLHQFLTIVRMVSYFACDNRIRTYTINKYSAKKQPFLKSVKFLYEKIPDTKKDIIFRQFQNTCRKHNINTNSTFSDMVVGYLRKIKKGSSVNLSKSKKKEIPENFSFDHL